MIQFNKNAFGLAPGTTAVPLGQIAPGATTEAAVPVALSAAQVAPGAALNVLQARHLDLSRRSRATQQSKPHSDSEAIPKRLDCVRV